MKKKKPTKRAKVVARRRETENLVRFIDAHGGKLGAFRGYGAGQPPPDHQRV